MSQEQQQQEEQLTTTEQESTVEQTTEDQTDISAAPENNADNATDDYERELAEFDAAIEASNGATSDDTQSYTGQNAAPEPATQEPVYESAPVVNSHDPRIDVLYARMQQSLASDNEKALDSAVSSIKEVAPAFNALGDRHVRGILEIEARDDPRFLKAFENRHIDEKAWKDLVVAKGKSLQSSIAAMPDSSATNGINTLRASVNSQSGGTTDNTNYEAVTKMSDAEFLNKVERGLI